MKRRSGNKRNFTKDSPQRRMSLFKSSASWFRKWEWQWFGTLTFPGEYQIKIERADAAVKGWLRRLCTGEGIQVGCFYALCRKHKNDGVHVHLLMLGEGRRNGQPKTLLNVDVGRWKRQWRYSSKIEVVDSQLRASRYLAYQFVKNEECKMEFYNNDLLKKKRSSQTSGRASGPLL